MLLFLVGTVNVMDRQILAILLEPIKRELGASDTQMGLITGVAFVVFFALATVPVGRAADTYSSRASTAPFVLAMAIYDRRRRGRVHPVTRWGGLALVLSFPGRMALAKTDLWLTVATWLIRCAQRARAGARWRPAA